MFPVAAWALAAASGGALPARKRRGAGAEKGDGRRDGLDLLDGFALLLVDDHPLFRDGLAAALRYRVPSLRVHAVGTPEQALRALAADDGHFDLALVDYRLPGMHGLRCARLLMRRRPGMGVGLISGTEDPTLPQRARAAGLVAYLPKTLQIDALLQCLQHLAAGQTVFEPAAGPTVAAVPEVPEVSEIPEVAEANPWGLTRRQIEVLRVLATGASNKKIAATLGIATATVNNHVEAIYAKVGASNRLQAVARTRSLLDGIGG